jgi:uncharacterized protein
MKSSAFFKFFLLVFTLTVPLWIIETIVKVKGLPLDVPITDLIATFTPMIAACILVYKEEGIVGIKRLLKRVFDFVRIRQKIWYLMPVIYLLIFGAMHLLGLPLPIGFDIPFRMMPIISVAIFIAAAGEELGYMGYAIDPIQERWGALKAAMIMGLL